MIINSLLSILQLSCVSLALDDKPTCKLSIPQTSCLDFSLVMQNELITLIPGKTLLSNITPPNLQ